MTAHFDLIIDPTEKLKLTVWINSHQIPGAVRPAAVRPHGPDELLGSEPWPPQVTSSHRRPTDHQLADGPVGHWLDVGVDNPSAVTAQRRSDPNGSAHRQFRDGCHDRGLGWPIRVEYPPRRRAPTPGYIRGADLAAQDEQTHRR